jgi:hypothetical protein
MKIGAHGKLFPEIWRAWSPSLREELAILADSQLARLSL